MRLRAKPVILALCGLAILSGLLALIKHMGYGLTYQVSPSMPMGWYYYKPLTEIHRGQWVSLKAPDFAEQYLQRHHLVPHSGVLIKAIAGVPGDFACQQDSQLTVNHRVVATLLERDRFQQVIARQHFCRYLLPDEYLVLGLSDPRSYDSRYFGPVPRDQLLSEAIPLTTLFHGKP
jgi:conjugative transfer signal peptidase TraF